MSSGGGGSSTSTTTSGPPQQFLDAYANTVNRATGVANQPLQQYSGSVVAGLSPDQQAGISGVQNAQGIANPFINAAAQEIGASNSPLQPTVQPYSDAANGLFMQAPGVASAAAGQANNYFAAAPEAANTAAQDANQYFGLASRQLTPTQFSAGQVNQYESPYTQQVVNATQNEFNNQNAQQQAGVVGNAISNNSFGGDRQAVAQALTAQQQQLAQAPVIANLENQGYAQALQEFNQQQQTGLGAQQATQQLQQGAGQGMLASGAQRVGAYQGAGQGILSGGAQQVGALQGAGQGVTGVGGQILGANEAQNWLASQAGFGYGNLGNEAQQTSLAGANALLGTGGLEQQVAQENLNVPYQQFIQQQAYPFQTTSFLANIAEGLGGAAGGNSSTTTPGPSALSQGVGLGLTGLGVAGQLGAFSGGGGGALSGLFSAPDATGELTDALGQFDPSLFMQRGGAVARAPGGMVPVGNLPPDLSVSYIPGGGAPSGHGSFNLTNPGMQNVSRTQGSGGGGGSDAAQGIGDALKVAGIAAMLLRDGGNVPERAFGGPSAGITAFPMHRARMPGTAGINDNQSPRQMHPMRMAAGGTTRIDIPQLPGGIVPNAGPGGNGILIPQVGTGSPSAGISSINDYLNASKAPPPPPRIIPNLAASIVPPPIAPSVPTSFVGNGESRNPSQFGGGAGGNSEGGGAAEGVGGGGDPGGVGAEAAGGGSNSDSSGAGSSEGFGSRGGVLKRAAGGDTDGPGVMERLRRSLFGSPDAPIAPADAPPDVPTMFPITARNSSDNPADWGNNSEPPPGAGISGPPPLQMPDTGSGSMSPPAAPPPQQQQAVGPPPPPAPAPSPGITAPVTQGVGGPPPQVQHPGEPKHPNNWGETLLAMGLGMMGGSSPYAGVNIGRGGLEGLKFAENQKLRQAQQADTAAYRQAMTDNRRYGIDTRAGTAADSTAARLQVAGMLNDRVNFWKAKGFNDLTANQKAMQDIRASTLDLNTQKAAISADQGQQRIDQGAQRVDQGAQRVQQAKEAADMRNQFKAQAATQADKNAADRATHAQMHDAVLLAGGETSKLPEALRQVMKGTAVLQPPRLLEAQTQQPTAPAGVTRVQSPEEAMKLPSGTQFMGPDGVLRQRP